MKVNFDKLVNEAKKEGVRRFSTGVIVMNEKKILLIKRTPDDFMGGIFEVPGGGIDEGETVDASLIRELKEETGLIVKKIIRFVDYFEYESSGGERTRQFNVVVDVENVEKVTLSQEHTEFVWVKKEDINKFNITDGTKTALLKAWENERTDN